MIRVRGVPYRDEDDAYDAARQEEVDASAESKRAASGMSPELLSLQEAFTEGARAGAAGRDFNVNPYQAGCPEHAEWERGRLSAHGMAA